jgi:hypothetical protein
MIYASLLYIPFIAHADQHVIDATSSIKVQQNISVYGFRTDKKDALKNIIVEVERNGFETSTANLNDLDNSVFMFRKAKNLEKLTPILLKNIISKQAEIQNVWQTDAVMPETQLWKAGKTDISITNTAASKMEEGNISLYQEISILDDGFERHSFHNFGVVKDGSVINILMTQPGKYFVILTTI